MISGCKSPSPFTGTLDQSKPRALSDSLRLPGNATPAFVVAGLRQGAIPQGMVPFPEDNTILTSHYFDDGNPSCLVSTDWKSGKAVLTFQLHEADEEPHTGHVGGLAADEAHLWIASDQHLYRVDRNAIRMASSSSQFQLSEKFRTEATEEVAFCSVFDGLVWAGEFALGSKFPTHPSHHLTARDGEPRAAWLSGYGSAKGFQYPEKVLSIPDRTQGAIATPTHIYLSRSYGRRNRSSLDIFENPLNESPHQIVKTSTGHEVPLWFLDQSNLVHTIDLPPMSENIFIHNDDLYVLFESGAKKFRFMGKKPLDYVIKLNQEELIP